MKAEMREKKQDDYKQLQYRQKQQYYVQINLIFA